MGNALDMLGMIEVQEGEDDGFDEDIEEEEDDWGAEDECSCAGARARAGACPWCLL